MLKLVKLQTKRMEVASIFSCGFHTARTGWAEWTPSRLNVSVILRDSACATYKMLIMLHCSVILLFYLAFIAALYIDQDLDYVRTFMNVCFFPRLKVSKIKCKFINPTSSYNRRNHCIKYNMADQFQAGITLCGITIKWTFCELGVHQLSIVHRILILTAYIFCGC